VTVPRGQKVQTSVQLKPDLEAPVAKGAVIGKVVATSNGKPVGEAPLVAQADVERAGFMLRAWQHVAGLFGKRRGWSRPARCARPHRPTAAPASA
jgi:D-alanyl-D-alanine carboxypeptidase (penicillin-binding protein 5/6)